jgi:hypothetical protein
MRFATDESKSQLEEAWSLLLNHDDAETRAQARRVIGQVLEGMERLEKTKPHPEPSIVVPSDDERRRTYPEREPIRPR